jgi:hypothetical protein
MGGPGAGKERPMSPGYPKKEANPAVSWHAVAAMQQDRKTTVQLSSHNH